MKTKITLLVMAFLISLSTFAQQGINYKALIKDNLGNVVANQTISVQFSILEDATEVYTETHAPTTNANGLIVLNIGTGTTSNVFTDINWGNNNHFLKTEIDVSGGTTYTDLGTTQFMAVPYALNAANVTGLEAIDEGNGIGWRLKGRDPDYYGNIGKNAIDLSSNSFASVTFGATGNSALALGPNCLASGFSSIAIGSNTLSRADYAVSFGRSQANGLYSFAAGFNPRAEESHSVAIGANVRALSKNEIALGSNTENYFPINPTGWDPNDRLLTIGNGEDSGNLSNAIIILKNGTITAPSFDLAEITDNKALITKEYADAYLVGSDIEALDDLTDAKTVIRSIYIGNGSGEDDNGNDNQNTALGYHALQNNIDGVQNVAIGETTLLSSISGNRNTAIGQSTMRLNTTGNNNTAVGEQALYSNQTGSGNVAIGQEAGSNELGDNKLYIENSSSSSPLIWGDFTDGSEKVQINGELEVTNKTTISEIQITTGAVDGYVLASDASGNASWQPDSSGSGLEAIDEGNGIGYRLKGKDPDNYGPIGLNAVDLSDSGEASTTLGATGNYATALGYLTTASGFGSMSFGPGLKAESYLSTAMGTLNIGGGNPISWDFNDPLFEIGNGYLSPSNALTILKNGKVGIGNHQPTGYLEVKAANSSGQPNLNLVHVGTTGARINFSNTDTTNGNLWTFYGDTNDVDANSSFNLFHTNTGNIINVKGDGKVNINGDLKVTNTTQIGASGVAISEVIKLTGVIDGTGIANIPYPAGYDWENTHVVSLKVKSTVGGLGVNWYTSLGNYTSGDGQSVYINLRNQVNPANPSIIQVKVSDSQYVGGDFSLVLMKID